jgi:hypothetical protein
VIDLPEPREALRRLALRSSVRLARKASRLAGVPFLLVGGAVRDALLGLPPGDTDIAAPAGRGEALAGALARLAGTRAVAIGTSPRRIFHVPVGRSSVDVWEVEGDPTADLLRRDFTVNALGLSFPGGRLVAPGNALRDLRERRLRLPRAGVLLEDPLRVVRAARFLARLPGFRLDPAALPELRRAAARLGGIAAERRLTELDAILALGPAPAALALARLETWGALRALLPGVPAGSRRRGVVLLSRASAGQPALLRSLLLAPAGTARATRALDALRASRRDRRLAEVLLALPPPSRAPSRREAVLLLRRAAPFSREAVAFLAVAHGSPGRALALEADRLLATRGALARVLKPRRPLSASDVAGLLGASGPGLGRALALLDEALATGAVRGRGEASALLLGDDRTRIRRTRTLSGSV